MPEAVQATLDYEGKIDRSPRNIDHFLELREISVATFLEQREAAVRAHLASLENGEKPTPSS
jgi:hypothetical protein